MPEDTKKTPSVPTNTGNPCITVAFPFSKIEIRDSEPELAELAAVVQALAEQVAGLAHRLTPEAAKAADQLVHRTQRMPARTRTQASRGHAA
jgi:hypothetical protein